MLSLKARLVAGLLLVAVYGVVVAWMALFLPGSSLSFHATDTSLVAELPDQSSFPVAAFVAGKRELPAAPSLALEEPDVLPDYAAINTFFEAHTWLHDALLAGELTVRDLAGNLHPVEPQPRSLSNLPGLFWLQLMCGLAGMVICLMVWLPAQNNTAIRSFALTGLSYVLFSSAAAIYSTRDLFMPGDWFVWLSGLNHLGALLFSTSLGAFLWNYPCKAPSTWLTGMFYLAFVVAIGLDQGQIVATPVAGFHLWVMGIFLCGLMGTGWQWWRTREQPEPRAALRWVVLSIVTGTAFFAGGMILPAILQMAEPASQGLLFTTFLLMYAGIAMGVVRYRLFDLERWWFSLWAWLLGGLLVMLTDMLLASLLHLSGSASLALAVVLVGWGYFPLRQYLWGKLFQRNQHDLDTWLAEALPAMLDAQREDQQKSGIEEALQAVFQPLTMTSQPSLEKANIAVLDKGRSLSVPEPLGRRTWLLHHAHEGARLFTRHDTRTAGLVLSLYRLVGQVHEARAEGVREERHRIRRDMHDDLGAKLLQLLHRSSDNTKPLVREAIGDLRDLLKGMEGESLSLEAAVLQWREEAARRCRDHGVQLDWQARPVDALLDASSFGELTRILREAVTNALNHSRTSTLVVSLNGENGQLRLVVENDGLAADSALGAVRGLDIMASRARKLGGSCRHDNASGRWRVVLEVPLSKAAAG